ncbi:GNAT family N-acetyltransferase [Sinorhizobium meliloti]|nr:GNAT family N-acetyltransferase [Sinorhizobium meliloti]
MSASASSTVAISRGESEWHTGAVSTATLEKTLTSTPFSDYLSASSRGRPLLWVRENRISVWLDWRDRLKRQDGDDVDTYRIEPHFVGIDDYTRLRFESGLFPFARAAADKGLKGTVFGVRVLHGEDVVGMGRIIGDGGCFFQVTDIAVEPAHQRKGLGKRIMTALVDYMKANLPETAYVSLIADVPANRLYEQFGFAETSPRSLGMAMRIYK